MNTIVLRGTIELLVSLLISYILVFRLGQSIRKQKKVWYVGTSVVSFLSMFIAILVFLNVINVDFSVWWVRAIRGIISGYLPATMFMFVMYAGAVPNQHASKKKLMSIRTELSIMAVILYLPHTLLYTAFSAPYGIKALLAGDINIPIQLMTWSGIINSVLLFVLGITSSNKIKQKMTMVKWRKLHKWSYVFYFNCFVHYMTLSIRGGHYERAIIYTVIYGVYLTLKLKKVFHTNNQSVLNERAA